MTNYTLFFDLDDTIYPPESGIWTLIGERIERYMHEKLSIPIHQITHLRKHYFDNYGTTLNGLIIHYGVDKQDFLAYVHDIPLSDHLSPDPELNTIIANLPMRKWIFTNADLNHTQRVLKTTQLEGIFSGVIDINAMEPYCKPEAGAFTKALEIAGATDARHCVLIEDSLRNIKAAREMGFYTIYVGNGNHSNIAHFNISEIKKISEAIEYLFHIR